MKPLLSLACAGALTLMALHVGAQPAPQPDAVDMPPAARALSANEAAGLPDLAAINRPGAQSSATVDFNPPRVPSFHERAGNGTEITEYRDRGKPVEIQVRSNFGTHYQMTRPTDTSPASHNSAQPSTRLPSIHLSY